MRINSNYRDYYDGFQAYCYGDSFTFDRHWEDCKQIADLHDRNSYLYREESTSCDFPVIVGFAGKEYMYTFHVSYKEDVVETHVSTTVEEYIEFKKRSRIARFGNEEIRKLIPQFYTKESDERFIALNSPIYMCAPTLYSKCRSVEIVPHMKYSYHCHTMYSPLNFKGKRSGYSASLSDIGFDRILSPENAYTELTGYIDFLGKEHKMVPEMSNDVKISSHGFDKASFRKRS